MRIVPDSTITLYQNVEIDNGEQLVFSSKANQTAYFQSKIHPQGAYTPCTVIRKTGAVRVEKSGTVVSACNYMSFINPSFDNRTVYARIIDYDYINNECVEITYAIDYWQTWMFDVQFEDSYIEREMLSQADETKAAANPYDPSIFEYRTSESLPVSKDLEKLNYVVGGNSNDDGYRITRAVDDVVDVDRTLGVLIKLNNIDFENLDQDYTGAVNETPSCLFANYLTSIVAEDLGFFCISKEMYTYLHDKHTAYPNDYPAINSRYRIGAGWKERDNTPIYPFKSSLYNPGCSIIYDPEGAQAPSLISGDDGNGHMGEFLELMTKWENVDKIIDMSIVPNNIMIFSGIPNAYAGGSPYMPSQTTPDDTNIVNKKLMRYPYSYLRVLTPNGDAKEYRYEWFKSITDEHGDGIAKLIALLDFTDRPTLVLAPKGYKYSEMSNSYGADANILEAIYFDQFPTMPYSIDAFTAQVAAVANYTIGNKTVDNAADMAASDVNTGKFAQWTATLQNALGAASSGAGATKGIDFESPNLVHSGAKLTHSGGASGMVGSALGVAGAVANTMNMYMTGGQMEIDRKKFEAASDRWFGANAALGEGDGGAIADQLRLAKPAYACDKYFASNGIGVTNFNLLSFCDIVFLRVSLSPEIQAIYDNWFSHFGYNSGRNGIPRVINYMHGSSTPADLPAWRTINSKETTYIKTMDCKIIYSMLPVAGYIKAMFDSGVRMIKGDLT